MVIAARLGPFGIELAGSGLDVLAEEPPHVVIPGLAPYVIATPHVAGATRDSLMASAQRLVENVRRIGSGGEPHWIRN